MKNVEWRSAINPYKFDYILPGENYKVSFSPIGIKALKALLLIENEDDPNLLEDALDKIIMSSVIYPEDFDVNTLSLQDRYSLMLQIRIASKGSTYTVETKCPTCGQYQVEIDLKNLPSKSKNSASGLIKINDNISVVLSQISRGEQKEVDAYIAKEMRAEIAQLERMYQEFDSGNPSISQKDIKKLEINVEKRRRVNKIFYSLAKGIRKIIFNGKEIDNLSFEDQKFAIEEAPKEKLELITNWFNENDYGVSFMTELKCPHMKKDGKKQVKCDYKVPYQIPLESFFV